MNDDYQKWMDTFASETEPGVREVEEARIALLGRPSDAAVSRALVRKLPRVGRVELMALRTRIEAAFDARRRWAPWLLLGAGSAGGGTILAAAVALLVVWAATRPPDAPEVLAVHLGSEGGPRVVQPSRGVELRLDGSGEVVGTPDAPRIEWIAGAITVEVEPGQGIAMTVVTREAVVRVVGTVFTVDRDALGTRVEVTRGKVEVACVGGRTETLTVGDEATCLPTTAPGLLARANQLKKSGAPSRQVLDAVRAGLPIATGPFRAELLALEAEMLLASGDHRQAWSAADAYLEQGGPRRLEVLQIAASAALTVDGCSGALRYLQELEEAGAGNPEQLERCEP